jgi:hypothetical protein
MVQPKLQWKGWHQFTGMPDFLKFVKANKDTPYNTILWLNDDCPIIAWLN